MVSTEFFPLEHSASFFGFPSKDGKILEADKKEMTEALLQTQ